jgi:hypothetical protein
MADQAHPHATPAHPDPKAEVPRVIAPGETMTFAEWCVVDKALAAADKAAYSKLYSKAAEEQDKAVHDATVATHSAFALYYGPRAEQKMDRATLDSYLAEFNTLVLNPQTGKVGQPPPAPVKPTPK